jgi:hypothetical protein
MSSAGTASKRTRPATTQSAMAKSSVNGISPIRNFFCALIFGLGNFLRLLSRGTPWGQGQGLGGVQAPQLQPHRLFRTLIDAQTKGRLR